MQDLVFNGKVFPRRVGAANEATTSSPWNTLPARNVRSGFCQCRSGQHGKHCSNNQEALHRLVSLGWLSFFTVKKQQAPMLAAVLLRARRSRNRQTPDLSRPCRVCATTHRAAVGSRLPGRYIQDLAYGLCSLVERVGVLLHHTLDRCARCVLCSRFVPPLGLCCSKHLFKNFDGFIAMRLQELDCFEWPRSDRRLRHHE